MKGIGYAIALIFLAAIEVACYLALKQYGFETPAAAGITFGLCITLFVLGGCLVLSRSTPYARYNHAGQSGRHAPTQMYRQGTAVMTRPGSSDGYEQPVYRPMGSMGHLRSDAFRDELVTTLEEKKEHFARLLSEAGKELERFDYSVLKTLERNSPGSIQGVLTARKIHHALEIRYKEIERFLASQPITDPEKGRQLLLGDLEIPDDKQLTSVFQGPSIPPIKIAEVEFHLKVLLKRISRRRSIFRAKNPDGTYEGMPEIPPDALEEVAPVEEDDLAPEEQALEEQYGLSEESYGPTEEELPAEEELPSVLESDKQTT